MLPPQRNSCHPFRHENTKPPLENLFSSLLPNFLFLFYYINENNTRVILRKFLRFSFINLTIKIFAYTMWLTNILIFIYPFVGTPLRGCLKHNILYNYKIYYASYCFTGDSPPRGFHLGSPLQKNGKLK